jgi:hypothetical protein
MANDARGEVSIAAGDKTYRLKFGTNSIAAVERKLGKSLIASAQEMEWVDVRRTMLWGAINSIDSVTRKPINDVTFSEDDVGFIMDLVPPDEVFAGLIAALNNAYPKPEKAPAKENP